MAKNGKSFNPNQHDLFQELAESTLDSERYSDLDLDIELRGLLAGIVRRARQLGLSRERIVSEMNSLMPDAVSPVTLRRLNSWTASSRESHRMPASLLPCFCVATQSIEPLHYLAASISYAVVDGRGLAAAELGKTVAERSALARRERELRDMLMDRASK